MSYENLKSVVLAVWTSILVPYGKVHLVAWTEGPNEFPVPSPTFFISLNA